MKDNKKDSTKERERGERDRGDIGSQRGRDMDKESSSSSSGGGTRESEKDNRRGGEDTIKDTMKKPPVLDKPSHWNTGSKRIVSKRPALSKVKEEGRRDSGGGEKHTE